MKAQLEQNSIGEFVAPLQSTQHSLHSSFRESALAALKKMDFPGNREEDWKYTRLNKFRKERFEVIENAGTDNIDALRADEEALLLVFVNGFFNADFSDKELNGIAVTGSISETRKENAFTKINEAFFTGGIDLVVQKGNKKIEILFISNNKASSQIRNNVRVESNASAAICFNFQGTGDEASFTNVVTKIVVSENAKLNLDLIQNESESNYHFNLTEVEQARDSVFSVNTITPGSGLIRNDLNIFSNGENTETHLNGLYLVSGNRHVDNHTVMDHRFPNCVSNELYKGVMDGKSTGVFNGKVFVRRDAQKINAFQSNANILLSDDAQINTKPELEIYADDVKCSHGSTTGQLDEEALFYLRARGIGEESARKLLVKAFAEDVTAKIENENVRAYSEKIIEERFQWNKA